MAYQLLLDFGIKNDLLRIDQKKPCSFCKGFKQRSGIMEENPYMDDRLKIGYEILSYLAEHPKSSDTLKGILQWWLLEQNIKYQNTKVKEALDELVKRGFVLEHKGKDLQVHYRINYRKNDNIRDFLKKYSEIYR